MEKVYHYFFCHNVTWFTLYFAFLGKFPIRRLMQLVENVEKESIKTVTKEQLLSRIHIEDCYDIKDALNTLVI